MSDFDIDLIKEFEQKQPEVKLEKIPENIPDSHPAKVMRWFVISLKFITFLFFLGSIKNFASLLFDIF